MEPALSAVGYSKANVTAIREEACNVVTGDLDYVVDWFRATIALKLAELDQE